MHAFPCSPLVWATNILPLTGPGLRSTVQILASTKTAGIKNAESQLSRVPWPGNSRMLFTFQPVLWVLQQPHKHSHSLQLATHTELAHHYIQYALSFFLSPRGFLQSTTWTHQSTEIALERAASHIEVTHPPCIFLLLANRSTTLIWGIWVMSSHYLSMEEITWFCQCHASYLKVRTL